MPVHPPIQVHRVHAHRNEHQRRAARAPGAGRRVRVGQTDDRAADGPELAALPAVADGELFVSDGVVVSVANAGLPGDEKSVRFAVSLSSRRHRPCSPPEWTPKRGAGTILGQLNLHFPGMWTARERRSNRRFDSRMDRRSTRM